MSNADFNAHRAIVEELITSVTLYPGRALVAGVIALPDAALRRPLVLEDNPTQAQAG